MHHGQLYFSVPEKLNSLGNADFHVLACKQQWKGPADFQVEYLKAAEAADILYLNKKYR